MKKIILILTFFFGLVFIFSLGINNIAFAGCSKNGVVTTGFIRVGDQVDPAYDHCCKAGGDKYSCSSTDNEILVVYSCNSDDTIAIKTVNCASYGKICSQEERQCVYRPLIAKITSSSNSTTVPSGTKITLTGSASGGSGKYSYEWHYYSPDGNIVSTSSTFTRIYTNGSYTYYLKVKDNETSKTALASITINTERGPSIGNVVCRCDNSSNNCNLSVDWWNNNKPVNLVIKSKGNVVFNQLISDSKYVYSAQHGNFYEVYAQYNNIDSEHKTVGCFRCTGEIPENASLCSSLCFRGDENLSNDTPISVVSSCSSSCNSKCQYVCLPGYSPDSNGKKCVSGGTTPSVPSLSFSVNPTTITIGQSVTLTWTVEGNATSCIATGEWSNYKPHDNGTYTETVSPATAGTKTYNLECKNSNGSSGVKTATITVNSTQNAVPTANITFPSGSQPININVGDSINFSGDGRDSDGKIFGYEWRSGACTDGVLLSSGTSVPNIQSISFRKAGTYTIYWRVKDDKNAWSDCSKVTIEVGDNTDNPICVDKCGDGNCDRNVCQAQGCPCSENENTCPMDCSNNNSCQKLNELCGGNAGLRCCESDNDPLYCKLSSNLPDAAGTCQRVNEFVCTGNNPENAILCQEDSQGLTANTPKVLVPDCTDNQKCEFVCNSPHYRYDSVQNKCVSTSDGGYSCYGGPSGRPFENATLCLNDDIGLAGPTMRSLVSKCTDGKKCEYTCNQGYILSGNRCVKDISNNSCQGNPPQNATLCEGDDQNIEQENVYKKLVPFCTTRRKCEYVCNNWQSYIYSGGTCRRRYLSGIQQND